jgi:hypothetical protein
MLAQERLGKPAGFGRATWRVAKAILAVIERLAEALCWSDDEPLLLVFTRTDPSAVETTHKDSKVKRIEHRSTSNVQPKAPQAVAGAASTAFRSAPSTRDGRTSIMRCPAATVRDNGSGESGRVDRADTTRRERKRSRWPAAMGLHLQSCAPSSATESRPEAESEDLPAFILLELDDC